jgi:hypothetical protein
VSTQARWTDPDTVTANAAGRLTPAQIDAISGPPVPVWRPFARRRSRRLRPAASPVRGGVGQIVNVPNTVWTLAITTDATITVRDDGPKPAPGRYILYWLEQGGRARLLSGEPLGPIGPDEEPPEGTAEALLSAVDAEPAELRDNRDGRLSRRQRRFFARKAVSDPLRGWAYAALVFVVIPVGPLATALIAAGAISEAMPVLAGGLVLLAGAVAWVRIVVEDEWGDRPACRAALRDPTPVRRADGGVSVTGPDAVKVEDRATGESLDLAAPPAAVRIFAGAPGRYVVHWLPFTLRPRLLSAEPAPTTATRAGP